MRFILEVMMLAKHLEIWWLSHLLEQNTYRYTKDQGCWCLHLGPFTILILKEIGI